MALEVSKLLQAIKPSATMAMAAAAKEVKATGVTVYDLSLGEPDFDTPAHIQKAAIEAMQSGKTHYTVPTGIPELKKAIVDKYKKFYGLDYDITQVVVSNGAKHALTNAFVATLNPGDEVILPAPFWVSYEALIELTGAKPIIVETKQENDFCLTAEELKAAITPKTKMLLLCSPSNPTGSMYSPEQLGEIADIVIEHDLGVVADEIYEHLVFPGNEFASLPTVRDGLLDRTILVGGVSKTYAMTGWRIGWTICRADIAKKIGSLQSQQTSNPCSISQYATIAALEGPQDCVAEMLTEFTKRKAYVQERIDAIEGLTCAEMGGAFYAYMNIKPFIGKTIGGVVIDNDETFCLQLLAQKQVSLVMGSAFGTEGFARASFATSMENLEAAFDRIAEFVGEAK